MGIYVHVYKRVYFSMCLVVCPEEKHVPSDANQQGMYGKPPGSVSCHMFYSHDEDKSRDIVLSV